MPFCVAGLETAADNFFIFVLNLVLTTLCAASVGFFISASVKVFAIANLLIALIYVFMMVRVLLRFLILRVLTMYLPVTVNQWIQCEICLLYDVASLSYTTTREKLLRRIEH